MAHQIASAVGTDPDRERPTLDFTLALGIVLIVMLQVCDIVTTMRVLAAPGGFEANPFMAWSQSTFGVFWWWPKVAVMLAVIYYGCTRRPLIVWIGVAIYIAIVGVNTMQLIVG